MFNILNVYKITVYDLHYNQNLATFVNDIVYDTAYKCIIQ